MASRCWKVTRLQLFLITLLNVGSHAGNFRFSTYYGNYMVLQRAPKRAVIWGYGTPGATVSLQAAGRTYYKTVGKGTDSSDIWSVTLDPISARGPFTITAKSEHTTYTLREVLFGDVWVCSGQSNMEFPLWAAKRGNDELTYIPSHQDVRIFQANRKESYYVADEFRSIYQKWATPNRINVQYYSAVCWMYGRMLYDKLKYPIGIVHSCWDGTPIELWSSPDALAKCNADISLIRPASYRPHLPSVVYNGMVGPLLRSTMTGVIWYQGESNAWTTTLAKQYKCQLPALINDWREKFYQGTGGQTDPKFAFGFVQLAPWRSKDITVGFPETRWYSTGGLGDVPNPILQNVFMAVAMDLPDPTSTWYGPIHPRYKTDIAQRLTLGSLAVAYGWNVKYRGPYPKSVNHIPGSKSLIIDYRHGPIRQQSIVLQTAVDFEVCCSFTTTCKSTNDWLKATVRSSNSTTLMINYDCPANWGAVAIRYAWRESPCPLRHCSIYNEEHLPAPPFMIEFNKSYLPITRFWQS